MLSQKYQNVQNNCDATNVQHQTQCAHGKSPQLKKLVSKYYAQLEMCVSSLLPDSASIEYTYV